MITPRHGTECKSASAGSGASRFRGARCIFLVDKLPREPSVLSIICLVFVLCILGGKALALNLFPEPSSLAVLVGCSMEAISFGLISVTVTPSRESFLWVSIAIALVPFAALGIKTALIGGFRIAGSLCYFDLCDFRQQHFCLAVAAH